MAVVRTGLAARPDPTMDRLAALVGRLLEAKVSLVSLVDDRRQMFPGLHGMSEPWSETRETPISESLCRLVVESADVVQIDDSAIDARTQGHGARDVLGVGSYLGVPLSDAEGNVLGSLCAINTTARAWTANERAVLTDLGFGRRGTGSRPGPPRGRLLLRMRRRRARR